MRELFHDPKGNDLLGKEIVEPDNARSTLRRNIKLWVVGILIVSAPIIGLEVFSFGWDILESRERVVNSLRLSRMSAQLDQDTGVFTEQSNARLMSMVSKPDQLAFAVAVGEDELEFKIKFRARTVLIRRLGEDLEMTKDFHSCLDYSTGASVPLEDCNLLDLHHHLLEIAEREKPTRFALWFHGVK